MRRMGRVVVMVCAAALGAAAQEVAPEAKALLERIERLERRVAELEAKQPATEESAAEASEPAQPLEERVAVVEAQVSELAQTRVESNSKLPVKLFGTVLFSTHYNTGEANWLDLPNVVAPPVAGQPGGSFSASLRQTRIGVLWHGPELGGMRTSGFLAFDFFGGIANFQTGPVMAAPRLLYGFVRLDGKRNAFEVGQDHAIFAAKNPTSLAALAFPDLYRSGNLYLRAPQARWEHRWTTSERSELQLMAGVMAPISGDYAGPFSFVPPALAGERSRQPALQARLGWKWTGGDAGAEIGVSGHRGAERFAGFAVTTWGTAVEFDFRKKWFGVGGEWFVGQNLDQFGGGLGQLARSRGGWAEARFQVAERTSFNTGYGTDRPYDRTLFAVVLDRNESVFANVIHNFTPEIAGSFEYRWLGTSPAGASRRENHHFDVVLAYSF